MIKITVRRRTLGNVIIAVFALFIGILWIGNAVKTFREGDILISVVILLAPLWIVLGALLLVGIQEAWKKYAPCLIQITVLEDWEDSENEESQP